MPLARLSRLLHIDLSYLLKGAFWGVAGQIVTAASSLLLSILFAHYTSKETFGTYRYLLSVANLFSALSLSGLSASIVQSVARGYHGAFATSFRTSLLWSSPAFAIALSVGAYYFFHGNLALAIGIPLTSLLVNIWNALLLFRSFAYGRRVFSDLFFANASLSIVPLAILFFTFPHTQDPVALVAVFLSTSCLISAIAHTYLHKRYVENTKQDPAHDSYSKHLSLIYTLDTVAAYLDKVLVFQYIGSAELAMYTYATAFPEQIRAITKSVQSIILPRFSVRPLAQIMKELNRKIALSTLGLLIIALGYIILAPWIFQTLFPQYLEAVYLSRLFAVILVFENGLSGIIFKAKRAIREQYILNIVGNIVKILLMISLLHLYGIAGVIMARILARAGTLLASFFLAKRFAATHSPT